MHLIASVMLCNPICKSLLSHGDNWVTLGQTLSESVLVSQPYLLIGLLRSLWCNYLLDLRFPCFSPSTIQANGLFPAPEISQNAYKQSSTISQQKRTPMTGSNNRAWGASSLCSVPVQTPVTVPQTLSPPEASKQVMSYVAAVCGKGEQVNRVKEQLLQSNPVLEGMFLLPLF